MDVEVRDVESEAREGDFRFCGGFLVNLRLCVLNSSIATRDSISESLACWG